VLSGVVRFFESKGFKVVSPIEVMPSLLVGEGPLGVHAPEAADMLDIARGFDVVRALGPFDVGQAVVVAGGEIEAIEGAENTDAMLARLALQRKFPEGGVGAHSFLGGMSGLENDLIPYGMALGNRAHLSGLIIVGLQRRGFSRNDIHDLRRAYRLLFAAEGTLSERTADVAEEFGTQPIVQEILAFIRTGGKRSLCTPKEASED
jgi:hypothetical protein